jgi:hypothetical protein
MSNSGDVKYSKSFNWDGSKYVLNSEDSIIFSDITDSTNKEKLNNAHYTCWNISGECTTLSYIYLHTKYNFENYRDKLYYINLDGGKSIKDALNEMLYVDDVNKYDSTIKTYLDTWYENNLVSYSNYLEDTIFCNDRSQFNSSTNGWNPNGGSLTTYIEFKDQFPLTDLNCVNETDKFSTLNSKAKLKYKIGLMNKPEMNLLNNNKLRNVNSPYWISSPNIFDSSNAYVGCLYSSGFYGCHADSTLDVRPAVSLAPGTEYIDGDGSTNNPYIIN